jgi:putative ABC transport system permease protein
MLAAQFIGESIILCLIAYILAIGLSTILLPVFNQLAGKEVSTGIFTQPHYLAVLPRNDSAKMVFKQSLASIPGVLSNTMASNVPGMFTFMNECKIENGRSEMQSANAVVYFVDYDYPDQMHMTIVAGRGFSRAFGTDSAQAMILNETAVTQMGYASPQQAIGKRFEQFQRTGTIIGVVRDFHLRSLQDPIKPLTMRVEPRACDLICATIDGQQVPATLNAVQAKWKALLKERPFSYFFLDEFFDRQYRSEENFGRLFLNFAILAIFISCLGLMGLAAYSTIQRTKEIGIRKVVGASVGNIVYLLSRDFLLLVGWAFLVAAPLAWSFVRGWLDGFAYRITSYWWIFALAGVTALAIALGAVSFQAIKAALVNPVKSLRTE